MCLPRYSHAHDDQRVAVAGASGYAGGEVLRLLLGHPDVEIGALTGGSNAGRAARRAAAAPAAARRPGARADHARELAGHDVVFLGLPHGQSGALAAAARRRHGRHRLRRRLPARPTPPRGSSSTAATTPAPGPTACPSCRASASVLRRRHAGSPSPAATRPSPRWRSPPPSPPAWSSPTSSWSPPPAPAAPARRAKPHLLGSEVMGNASAYGVGGVHRHTPEIVQNLAAPRRRRRSRVSFTPMLVPMSRGILATCSAPLRRRRHRRRGARGATPRRTPTSRSCTCCPRASGRRPSRCSAPTPCTSRSPSTRPPAGWSRSAPSTTSPRAPAAPPCSASTSPSASHEAHSACTHGRARAMSVTAPAGLPRRRRRRRAQVDRRPGRRARRQRRPAPRLRQRLHRQPLQGQPGAVEPAGRRRTASSARSCSTPAAPTATPAPRASRPPTPSPSGSPTASASARSTSWSAPPA